MKATACVAIVALAIGFVSAQAPASGNATATPAAGAQPGALSASAPPAVNASGTSPSPSPSPSPEPANATANTTVTGEPAAANATANTTANTTANATATEVPAAANATKPANITNTQISAYYSSPLFAIQNTPQLKQLAQLGAGSAVAKLLNNKTLVATIFAPNNEAVTRAVQFVANATGADAKSLAEQGVVDQLLTYHVAEGAAVLEGKFKNNTALTMLDGNQTTILVEEPVAGARKLLQAGNATYYIVSDSNQRIQLSTPANIQGGKSIIHVIDGVLVPQALLDQYNITDTAQLPGVEATNASTQAAAAGSNSREVTSTPTTSTPAKSSAATAVAALLAVPTLLAAVMF